jgi:hypothetical protein
MAMYETHELFERSFKITIGAANHEHPAQVRSLSLCGNTHHERILAKITNANPNVGYQTSCIAGTTRLT